MSDDKELELELVQVEPEKNKLEEIAEQFNRLNQKLDIIFERIAQRKKEEDRQ